jgi:pyruvate dehydrogenase E1 component beta subunit
MVKLSMDAAATLAGEGIDCEVVDLRSLSPLDGAIVIDSVKKTGRLVVADTGWKSFGVGAELSARVLEKAFKELKAPVVRVNPPDVPTPSSHVLEEAFYPGPEEIVSAVKRVLAHGN